MTSLEHMAADMLDVARQAHEAKVFSGLRACARDKHETAIAAYTAIIPRIRTLRKEGTGFQAICHILNEEGFRTRTGAMWIPGSVHRILERANKYGHD